MPLITMEIGSPSEGVALFTWKLFYVRREGWSSKGVVLFTSVLFPYDWSVSGRCGLIYIPPQLPLASLDSTLACGWKRTSCKQNKQLCEKHDFSASVSSVYAFLLVCTWKGKATFLGREFWVCIGVCVCMYVHMCVCAWNTKMNIPGFVLPWVLESARALSEER